MSQELGLDRLLKALATHSDLIAQAYYQGVVYKTNKNHRALNQLKQLKILVKHSVDGYRISGRLGQFVDSALSSDRLRRLDTDLASWVDTLEQQILLYQDAWDENRVADWDNYSAEIERLVFDLSDNLEENTSYLLMLINSRFANVRTLTEKKKQNVFYISRVERLVDAISALQPEYLLEMVDEHPALYELIEQQLIRLLPVYQQRLQDILDKLKTFLFELRQIEARAQLVQGFAFFLRQNPVYETQDWSEQEIIPEQWNQIKPLQLSAAADTLDYSINDDLVSITKKLRLDSDTLLAKKRKRKINKVEQVERAIQVMELPMYRKWLRQYFSLLEQQAGTAISAVSFQQRHVQDIEPELWLGCVLNEWLRQQQRHTQIKMEFIEYASHSAFTGNKKVKDIVLSWRTDAQISKPAQWTRVSQTITSS
ncbi:MAG: hypothetical protein methR_P0497 [Methyloprofundus sp.]|nr:MAG: hypothetical protein methR_P0497 [Methyloprofundus sp.]